VLTDPLLVRVEPTTDGDQHVPLGEDADSSAVRVVHHGGAHPTGGHAPRRLSQGVVRADREDLGAHRVADTHRDPSLQETASGPWSG
jgi:hypothetical protein